MTGAKGTAKRAAVLCGISLKKYRTIWSKTRLYLSIRCIPHMRSGSLKSTLCEIFAKLNSSRKHSKNFLEENGCMNAIKKL